MERRQDHQLSQPADSGGDDDNVETDNSPQDSHETVTKTSSVSAISVASEVIIIDESTDEQEQEESVSD